MIVWGFPLGETLYRLLEEGDTVVGRAIVDKDELHVVERLIEQAFGAAHDVVFDFIDRNNDGNFIHRQSFIYNEGWQGQRTWQCPAGRIRHRVRKISLIFPSGK